MFLISGTLRTKRKLGSVADYCPICRAIRAFKLLRIGEKVKTEAAPRSDRGARQGIALSEVRGVQFRIAGLFKNPTSR